MASRDKLSKEPELLNRSRIQFLKMILLMSVNMLVSSVVSAQEERNEKVPAELQHVLDSLGADPKHYYEFGLEIIDEYPDSSIQIFRQGTVLAEKLNNKEATMRGLINQGEAYRKLFETDSAKKRLLIAFELAKELNDSAAMTQSIGIIGDAYFMGSDYPNAAKYYSRAFQTVPNADTISRCEKAKSIALSYYIQGSLDSATVYQEKAVRLAHIIQDSASISQSHMTMGLIFMRSKQHLAAVRHFKISSDHGRYSEDISVRDYHYTSLMLMGNTLCELNELDSAETCFKMLADDPRFFAESPQAFGYYFHYPKLLRLQEKYDEAIEALLKSREMMPAHLAVGFAQNSYSLGEVYLLDAQFEKAQGHMLEAIKWYEENNNTLNLPEAYKKLSEIKFALQEYREAYELQSQFVTIKDSLNRAEADEKLKKLNAEFELTAKENEISLLTEKTRNQELVAISQRKNTLILLFSLAGLLIIVGLIFLAWRRIRGLNQKLTKQNQEIKKAEELKSRWFVNISHELRTPLALIQGPLKKVLSEENTNAVVKDDLKMANRNVDYLSNIVNEILDVSKISDGKLDLQLEITNLSSLVKQCVASFESLAQTNKVELISDIQTGVFARIDEQQVRKVLINLISNALKFTHEDGSIVVKLYCNESHIVLEVRDTGEGIPHEDLEHIFDRFFQSNLESRARRGGTGVGLSLAKEIAHMHKGDLEVRSKMDEGTTFTFLLPIKLKSDAPTTEDERQAITDNGQVAVEYELKSNDKPVILIVDDNQDMRSYLKSILKRNFKVIEARDGIEGLDKLENNVPHLIISDVMMPRMDGISFAREVRNHKKMNNIPMIMLTALQSEEDKLYSLRIGMDDYIHKPFNAEELLARVNNLVTNRVSMLEEERSHSDKILSMLENEVRDNMKSNFLSVAYLADKASLSERQFRRVIKSNTGLSPIHFIQEIRLQKSRELLEGRIYPTLAEVAHEVGFERTSHFSQLFEKRFGKKPSEYLD